jgi:hypothetical protein
VHFTLVNLILLMRWSGLAILNACSLKRDALKSDNTLKTYRQKINKAQAGPDGCVYIKIPDSCRISGAVAGTAEQLSRLFFWHGRGTNKAHAHTTPRCRSHAARAFAENRQAATSRRTCS